MSGRWKGTQHFFLCSEFILHLSLRLFFRHQDPEFLAERLSLMLVLKSNSNTVVCYDDSALNRYVVFEVNPYEIVIVRV
jgi:hypothetical protein